MGKSKQTKYIGDVTPTDFREYPIWTWYQDDPDTSLVIPIDVERVIEGMYLALFVFCELTLADGTIMEGNISFDCFRKSVYVLRIYQGDNSFLFSGSMFPYEGTLQHLSDWLQKPIEAITPLRYYTPYSFPNGDQLAGEISLQ